MCVAGYCGCLNAVKTENQKWVGPIKMVGKWGKFSVCNSNEPQQKQFIGPSSPLGPDKIIFTHKRANAGKIGI